MILTLNKPINISLQSKPSNVVDNVLSPQNGAWDIIYFCRINNSVQDGNVYRLGKVIDIIVDGSIFGPELVNDGDFSSTLNQGIATTGNYWTTENTWRIVNGTATHTSINSNTSTLSQSTANPSVTSYNGGEYIKTGRTYQVSFDILTVGTYSTTQTVNGTFTDVKEIILDSVTGLSIGMFITGVSSGNLAGAPKITNINGNTITLDVNQTFADGITLTFKGSNIRIGGYTQPNSEIFDQTTTLGTKTVEFTADSDGLSIIASANAVGWEIDNISVKEIFKTTNSTYIIKVDPDATAQSPTSGDFIFFGKDNQIGTAGVTGYYAAIEMKNDSIDYAELFAVSSEITQSSK